MVAVLDTLLCIMVDHEPLQKEFMDLHGVETCVKVLKNTAFGREVRAVSFLKCRKTTIFSFTEMRRNFGLFSAIFPGGAYGKVTSERKLRRAIGWSPPEIS